MSGQETGEPRSTDASSKGVKKLNLVTVLETNEMNELRSIQLIEEIWTLWFEGRDTYRLNYEYPLPLWFEGGWPLDFHLTARYGTVLDQFSTAAGASQSDVDKLVALWKQSAKRAWPEVPARGHMALVILLDQFPRNIHRGTSRMFATDDLAISIAVEALDTEELSRTLSRPERLAMAVCLEHAEDIDLSRRHMDMLRQFVTEIPDSGFDSIVATLTDGVGQGQKHYDILERFGRYPYRNAILGRTDTKEEDQFLRGICKDLEFVKSVSTEGWTVPSAAREKIDQYLRENPELDEASLPLSLLRKWQDEIDAADGADDSALK